MDKFHKAAQSSVPPLGFRTSRSASVEPGLLIIVSMAPDAIKNTADLSKASGILVRANSLTMTEESIKSMVETIPDVPIGLYLEDAKDKEVTAMAEAGVDFLVFPTSSRIYANPTDKKTGRVIQVESAMDNSLLRTLNSLPVDAVLAADTFAGGALVWQDLMIFQHLANTLAKPLIINIPSDITEIELKALWEAGIDGVIVEASTLKASGLKKMREAILKLPPRTAKKRGKIDVLLPRTDGETRATPPPDEEEEDE